MFIENPIISILIPCYNVSRFVEKAVHSILSQTYTNLEVWIIDDASTDDTLEKINLIDDKRIKVVTYKKNTRKVGAVNEVLQKVAGDFIAFQDADDWSEPERIQKQLEAFQMDGDLGICFTNYRYIGERIYLPGKIAVTNEDLKNEFHNFTYNRQQGTSPTNCPTMMISKAALKQTKGYSSFFAGRVGEDIQWIYRILKDFKGITIDKILYNYNQRHNSFTEIQATGVKPKYAYSWQLLQKVIYKDIHEGIDVLAPENIDMFKQLELEACEQALKESIQLQNKMRNDFEQSASYIIGQFLLRPLKIFRKR